MEFEIAGKVYRSGKMNARKQFHVARKLGPIFAKIGPSAMQTKDFSLIGPVADALSEMSEADCDYVLDRCLEVVQVKLPTGNFMNIWNAGAKDLQFQDIDLSIMVQITVKVLEDNLANFMTAPASASPELPQPGSDTLQKVS